MQVADLLAREAIRDLVARYNAYGDSGLFDRMLELFAPDAALELPEAVHTGHAEIRSFLTGVAGRTATAAGGPAYVRHFTSTHQIDLVDATTATGRCYFLVLTAAGVDHWGRYLDDYRRVADEWRFARRRVITDALSPGSIFHGAEPG